MHGLARPVVKAEGTPFQGEDEIAFDRYHRVILCHGCFDLLHLGHVRHLQEARKLGDELVVSVTNDPNVRKGVGRPVFTAEERAEALMALECVDRVIINDGPDAVTAINAIRPAVYVKGDDYAGKDDAALKLEIAAVEACGGRFHTTKAPAVWSSSRIINSERFPDSVLAYLDSARSRGFLDRILDAFRLADVLQIAFIGETIIDQYRYVDALGKPSKELILATVQTQSEAFSGGVVAASKHAEWKNVNCITPDKAITKTRFVEPENNRKMFEFYSSRRINLNAQEKNETHVQIEWAVENADAVVVFDFGHGLMDFEERETVSKAKFVAINAQTNAGNYGFNPITRYHQADYICVDDPEARLATALPETPIDSVITALANRIDSPCITVTHGRHGTVSYDRRKMPPDRVVSVPALALGGVDTIGAGDAFLAVAAPLLATGLDLEAATFAGNVAGAIKVSIVGHRSPVKRDHLLQSITSLLK